MKTCFICGREASTVLGIRLRIDHGDRDAVWAPDLRAYLCHTHAISGADIEIRYAENLSQHITARVLNNGHVVSERDHEIGERATILQRPLL